jgi:hypothetical protein
MLAVSATNALAVIFIPFSPLRVMLSRVAHYWPQRGCLDVAA